MPISRAGGGSTGGRKMAQPSAQELQRAIGAGRMLGYTKAQMTGLFNVGLTSPLSNVPTAASKGSFNEFLDLSNDESILSYYNPQSFRTAQSRNQAGEAIATGIDTGLGYFDAAGNPVDRSSYRQSYDEDEDTGELIIPGIKGPQADEGTAPAPISMVPTSTSNPERPRTVGAGYDSARQVLTVIFRDGTFYNYYEVNTNEWSAFKSTKSKGVYIYSVLDYHPRGPASTNDVSPKVRENLYRIARAVQVQKRGRNFYAERKKAAKKRTTTKKR